MLDPPVSHPLKFGLDTLNTLNLWSMARDVDEKDLEARRGNDTHLTDPTDPASIFGTPTAHVRSHLQDVDEKDLEARRGNDTHFAGLHPQIQAAILLVERFSETLHEYGEFQGHPHRSVSHECACLIRNPLFGLLFGLSLWSFESQALDLSQHSGL